MRFGRMGILVRLRLAKIRTRLDQIHLMCPLSVHQKGAIRFLYCKCKYGLSNLSENLFLDMIEEFQLMAKNAVCSC